MVIGPSQEFSFVDHKTSEGEYIVGVQEGRLITQTSEGLVRTDLGERHLEMLERLRDANEWNNIEMALGRAEIARLNEEIAALKRKSERSKKWNNHITADNIKLRQMFDKLKTEGGEDIKSLSLPKRNVDEVFFSKFANEFEIFKIMGEGGFGVVFKAINTLDKQNYAVKRIAVSPCAATLDKELQEVRTMSQLDHPGIVRYNSTWVERPPEGWQRNEDNQNCKAAAESFQSPLDHNPKSAFIYIQMQLCDSSLFSWLKDNRESSSRKLPLIKSWFKQIVIAVNYIHEQKMIHRDLKPANILLIGTERIKLCDLGIATHRKFENNYNNDNEISTMRTDIKTMLYMSPEQDSLIPIYSSKVDVFAMGLILAELCVVMWDDEREKIFDAYRCGEEQNNLFDDAETAQFVAWLLTVKSKKRPRCPEILNHRFLSI